MNWEVKVGRVLWRIFGDFVWAIAVLISAVPKPAFNALYILVAISSLTCDLLGVLSIIEARGDAGNYLLVSVLLVFIGWSLCDIDQNRITTDIKDALD